MQKGEEQAASLGETFLNNLNNDQNIDNLLAVQGLEWDGGQNLSRTSSGLDPEIMQIIFSLPKPEADPIIQGQQLSSGTCYCGTTRVDSRFFGRNDRRKSTSIAKLSHPAGSDI